MLDQRRRRWADFLQMIYKCFFVFAGIQVTSCEIDNQQPTLFNLGEEYDTGRN